MFVRGPSPSAQRDAGLYPWRAGGARRGQVARGNAAPRDVFVFATRQVSLALAQWLVHSADCVE